MGNGIFMMKEMMYFLCSGDTDLANNGSYLLMEFGFNRLSVLRCLDKKVSKERVALMVI